MGEGEQIIRENWRRWNEGLREYEPEIFDPAIEIHSTLTGQVFKGADGVSQWVTEIDEQFESWELLIDEIEELPGERLVVRGSARVRGRQSGLDLDQPMTWRVDLRDGRILRLENRIGWESE